MSLKGRANDKKGRTTAGVWITLGVLGMIGQLITVIWWLTR